MNVLRNVFAGIGLVLLTAAVAMYILGWRATQDFDPKATQVIGEFARRALETDFATASVIKMPLAEGVGPKESAQSMKVRANQRNIKLVSRLVMHKQVKAATGKAARHVEIFQFCDPLTAVRLLEYNPDFVAHMPCRIALYEDAEGRFWLSTVNLELLIHGGRELDQALKEQVVAIKDGLLDIMAAGASGDL